MKFSVTTTLKNAQGGNAHPVTLDADNYRIHPCGALEFYTEQRNLPDQLVALFASGTWSQVTKTS